MKKTILFLLLTAVLKLTGQPLSIERSVVAAQGGTDYIFSMSMSYTIGQPIATTIQSGNLTLTQGFEQPFKRQTTPVNTTCTQYTVENTNQRCNPATYVPLALQLGVENLRAEAVTLQKSNNGTAILRGNFRDATWKLVSVTINLSGGSATGTAIKTGCLTALSLTTDWTFYSTWSGTIQRAGQPPLSITGSSPVQIGTGANTQDVGDLGFYGRFNTTVAGQTGIFAFKLTNPSSCTVIANSISKARFETSGRAIFDKIQLTWYENIAEISESFKVEKLNRQGSFELLDYIKAKSGTDTRDYTTVDNTPTEGDNFYQITLLKNDGTTKSQLVTVKFEKSVYAQVFPNPTDGLIDVLLNSAIDSELTIGVYNSFGQLIQTVKSQKQLIHLDLSDNAAGLYLIRVSQKGKRDFTKQVVLQK